MSDHGDTKRKIIEVASGLFLTQGYEKTRIADIINGLDGLTKGAIYPYFESKEDIFNAVVEGIGNQNVDFFDEIMDDSSLTGLEKLRKIIASAYQNDTMNTITGIAPNLLNQPKLLSASMSEIIDTTIPKYLLPLIEEGVSDQSIHTESPEELAEAIAILLNVWMNPLIFQDNPSSVATKMAVMNSMLKKFGIELFEQSLITQLKAK